MHRESRHAAYDEIVAMRVRDHNDEIGVERAELVADLQHRRIHARDLRFVLGCRQCQELRGVRHDGRTDDPRTARYR